MNVWLRIKFLYAQWRLEHARQFRADLEHIIKRERARADYDMHECERLASVAEIELAQYRALVRAAPKR